MRYVVQFLVPALILLAVIYAVTRSRRHSTPVQGDDEPLLSTPTFLLILVISAVFTVAVLFGVQGFID